MALNIDNVEITIDVEETEVNLTLDPTCTEADSERQEDRSWDPQDFILSSEYPPAIAGPLLAQPACSTYDGWEVIYLTAADPLCVESEQPPMIEDCSQESHTDFLYQNENNQEKGKLYQEVTQNSTKYSKTKNKPINCERCMKSFASRIPYLCHEVIHHQSSSAKKELQFWTSQLPATPTIGKDQNSKPQQSNDNESATNGCHNCHSSILHRCHLKNDRTVNKCRYCSQVFDSQNSFNEHLLTHPQHLRSACVFCETQFGSKQALINHLSANTCPRLLCKICLEQVFNKNNLKEHKERHAEECNIKCGLCPKVFPDRKMLRMHIKGHTGPPVKCPVCYKKLFHATSLKQHIAKHSCKICGLKFPVIGNPANKKHILTHNVPSKYSVTCNICDKILCNKGYLKTHLRRHFNQRIKCPLCKSTYSQHKGLAYHMRTRHVSEQTFKCETCGMSFVEKVDLSIHKRNRHNIESGDPIPETQMNEIMYKCSLCPRNYGTKTGLSNHFLVEHNTDSEEVHVCDVCAMVFTEQNDLKLHWLKHIGPQTLQCHFCKKCKKLSIKKVVADQQNSPTKISCTCEVNLIENRTINSKCGPAEMTPVEVTADGVLLSQMGVASLHMGEERKFPSEGPIRGGESVPENSDACILLDFVLPDDVLDSQKEPATSECMVCNTKFATGLELESHRQNHWDLKLTRKEAKLFERRIKTHGIGSYTCSNCYKKFFVRHDFKQHLRAAILNLDGTLTCDPKKVHKSSLRKPFPCETCGLTFSSVARWYLHIRGHTRRASDINLVKSSVCPATFKHQSACDGHMRSHRNVKRPVLRKPLPCDTSGKASVTKTDLQSHGRARKRIDIVKEELICSICEKTFTCTAEELVEKLANDRTDNMTLELSGAKKATPKLLNCAKCSTVTTSYIAHAETSSQAPLRAEKGISLGETNIEYRPNQSDLELTREEDTNELHERCIETYDKECNQTKVTKNNLWENNIENAEAMCRDKSSRGLDKKLLKIVECQTCAATFKSKSELRKHIMSHETEEMVCSVCNETFASAPVQSVDRGRQSVMNRMPVDTNLTTNANPKPIRCATCSAATTNAKAEPCSLRPDETNIVKTEVNATFTSTPGPPHYLLFHPSQDLKTSIRENPEPLKCSICDKTFTTKAGILSHLRSHEGIKRSTCASTFSEEFLCDICGQFIQNRYRNVHMQKHFGFGCDLCKESFSSSHRLNDHLRIHMKAMHLVCNICRKFFKAKSKLANHLTLDHNIPLADIDFSKHLYTVPSGSRYKCDDCGLDYSDIPTRNLHQRTHHRNPPSIKCDVCNRTFARQSNLVAHMTLHSSKRGEYECDFCKIRFLNLHQMEVHLKRHTNEKRFKCDQCSAVFTESSRLRNHMLAHSRLRGFVCTLCGRKYKRNSSLAFHMKSHMEKDVSSSYVQAWEKNAKNLFENLNKKGGARPC